MRPLNIELYFAAAIMLHTIAATSSSLLPIQQIEQTSSIPADVLSIFEHYFPSSLMTNYDSVTKELGIIQTGQVTIFDTGGTPSGLAETSTSPTSPVSSFGLSSGGRVASSSLAPTTSATSALPSPSVSSTASSTPTLSNTITSSTQTASSAAGRTEEIKWISALVLVAPLVAWLV